MQVSNYWEGDNKTVKIAVGSPVGNSQIQNGRLDLKHRCHGVKPWHRYAESTSGWNEAQEPYAQKPGYFLAPAGALKKFD